MGIIRSTNGSICVSRIIKIIEALPLYLNLEIEYAPGIATKVEKKVATALIKNEFLNHISIGLSLI
jgi:hypothetical protein